MSTRRLPRRGLLLAVGPMIAAAGLVACTEKEPEPVGPAPITEVGAEVASPSGEYVAVIDTAGDAVGVLLRDADGTDLWADDYAHTRTEPPSVLWEDGQDVLWVVSGDSGAEHTRITLTEDGGWSQERVADLPEEIAARL